MLLNYFHIKCHSMQSSSNYIQKQIRNLSLIIWIWKWIWRNTRIYQEPCLNVIYDSGVWSHQYMVLLLVLVLSECYPCALYSFLLNDCRMSRGNYIFISTHKWPEFDICHVGSQDGNKWCTSFSHSIGSNTFPRCPCEQSFGTAMVFHVRKVVYICYASQYLLLSVH